MVLPVMYGFNLGESSLPFLSVVVALFLCVPLYCSYYYYIVEPRVLKNGSGPPEERLIPGLVTTLFIPAGLFLFGESPSQAAGLRHEKLLIAELLAWTVDPKIHWIASTIGVCLVMVGKYTIMQSIFLYLPLTYPQYGASLFAANDFARSSFAAGCIVFSGPMFKSLGVAKGVTLLGGLTVGCTAGLLVLYFYGAELRKRSKFAVK
jgi:DHA1 family multidrug resistance protein-like MFS transporter